jgi:hypothetical protein
VPRCYGAAGCQEQPGLLGAANTLVKAMSWARQGLNL